MKNVCMIDPNTRIVEYCIKFGKEYVFQYRLQKYIFLGIWKTVSSFRSSKQLEEKIYEQLISKMQKPVEPAKKLCKRV